MGTAPHNSGHPTFVSVSGEPSDPVGKLDGAWGFWDETWSEWYGGFHTEDGAREALRQYADTL